MLPFHFDCSLCCKAGFSLVQPHLFFLAFVDWGLVWYLKNYCQGQCWGRLPLGFHRSFLVSGLIFRFFSQFKLVFLCMVKDKGPISIFWMWKSRFPSIICWRDYPFLMSLLKMSWLYVWIDFWVLYSVPLAYFSILMLVPLCWLLQLCNIILNQKVWSPPSSSFSFLGTASTIRDFLWFHRNFKIVFSISMQNGSSLALAVRGNSLCCLRGHCVQRLWTVSCISSHNQPSREGLLTAPLLFCWWSSQGSKR